MFFVDVALLVLIVVALYWFGTKRKHRQRTITEELFTLPGASLNVTKSSLFHFPKAPKGSEPYFLCFDTETCSTQPGDLLFYEESVVPMRVVVLSYALLDTKGRLIESHCDLLHADETITPEAEQIHGISTAMMQRSGHTPTSVYTPFARSLEKAKVVVAHNLFFHKVMMDADCLHYGLPSLPWSGKAALCTMNKGEYFMERLNLNPTHKAPRLTELYGVLYFRKPDLLLSYTNKGEADLKLLIAVLLYMLDAHTLPQFRDYDLLNDLESVQP